MAATDGQGHRAGVAVDISARLFAEQLATGWGHPVVIENMPGANKTRSPAAPDVPTAAEAGYPQLSFDGVTGFFGGRDMPAALRDRIAADVRAVADSPAVRERLAKIGIVARSSTPSEFVAAIEEQRAKVAGIAAALGTKPTQ